MGLLCCAGVSHAASLTTHDWSLCPTQARPVLPQYGDNLIHALADKAFLRRNGASELLGDVQITRGNQTLISNALDYNNKTQEAISANKLILEMPSLRIQAASGRFNLGTRSGELLDSRYAYYPAHAQGHATRIDQKNPTLTTLTHTTYSTCPIGHEAWVLSASKMRLNQKSETGTARNVVLRFKGVPILYTPWLSFPLSNARKSGLLPPTFSQTTNSGFEYSQPIYWNIAPQADATFTPKLLSRRGFALGTQLRYLGPHSYTVFNDNYLPYDQLYGAPRWFYSLQQQAEPLPGLSTNINYNRVSDNTYFTDLGNSLGTGDVTQLERSVSARYASTYWNAGAQILQYQILDPALTGSELSYEKLPEIYFNAWTPYAALGGLQTSLHSNWTNFQRSGSVTGSRLTVTPGLSLPLTGSAWFMTPAVKYRYTRYQLYGQTPGTSATPTLGVPIVSLDTGLYFERNISSKIRQTLEPRAYYLYVPYRNQQTLPVFDTTLNDFSFNQLFSDNRFSGGDRIGDADQLSLALTTRFINTQTGTELLSAGIGQILYFRPRRVTLPGNPVQTQPRSDYAGMLNAALARHWTGNASLTYNPYARAFDTAYLGLQYHLGPQRLINLGYQYNRAQTNQANISFLWPITTHWQSAARWDFSVRNGHILDAFLGVQYNSCCWAARILARRYVTTTPGTYNNGVYFELVLKGLGNLGNSIGTYIQRTIPDYAPSS
ncbi:hypothetical protein BW247_14315 [Acidihalobacter ferrooxydans]|uniref:LPS-assembly protein LptD n=1 Tax=Acidihalobacter ferrooxydans TaxID=1765967 RepID=A0A1P8ULM1_9GAMM|nr:hypothetical protein BW247_14315 [Acidihalobacter ferrooxydans]